METIRSFEDLECWRACRQLRSFVTVEVLRMLPREEKYELSSQLKRACRSATANIAEGFGRFHHRENYKFCSNARGSLFEVLDHLIAARDENLISDEVLAEGRRQFERAVAILNGYMKYLQRAAENGNSSLREGSDEYLAVSCGEGYLPATSNN